MAILGEHNILSITIEDNGPTINWTPEENGEESWQTTLDSSQFIPANLKAKLLEQGLRVPLGEEVLSKCTILNKYNMAVLYTMLTT